MLLLMFVTAIPFSTETLHHGGRDSHLAAAIYGLPVLGVALSFTALCAWAARPGLLHVAVGAAGRLTTWCAIRLLGRSGCLRHVGPGTVGGRAERS